MKLSERLHKTAKLMDESASVWDNWEAERWRNIADEVELLEAELRNTQIRIDERDTKLANQAIAITKLEQSRKDLTALLQDSE